VLRFSLWLAPVALVVALGACGRDGEDAEKHPARRPAPPQQRPPIWAKLRPPGEGEALAVQKGVARVVPAAEARASGLLVVDVSDGWAPFIFSETDLDRGPDAGPPVTKPNAYRKTFLDLANDRVDPEDVFLAGGATRALDLSEEDEKEKQKDDRHDKNDKEKEKDKPRVRRRTDPVRNHLEVFGIPPTLSVLLRRVEDDARKVCFDDSDVEALKGLPSTVTYQNNKAARREFDEAAADATWFAGRIVDGGAGGDAAAPSAQETARLARHQRGQARVRAIKAAQARLACEGLLPTRSKYQPGMFDLPTHQALAEWERKNDIFGWGFLGEETLVALQRPPLELHFETWKRILTERLVDAAGIIEDGTAPGTRKQPASYKDAAGQAHPIPNLLGAHLDALMAQLEVTTPEAMVSFLRAMAAGLPRLQVAFTAPTRPPYYGPPGSAMDLEVEIDRGDIWYDFPFDGAGKPREQLRQRYPHLTVLVRWKGQRIPLARWRTTIGSWRSELGEDGRVYYKYKNSDVGPRIWKQVVAAPVWVPPDSTPAKDLLTRKVFDLRVGPVDVVNTDVMGPGFQSAYGMVMAIHHKVTPGGGLFDNQIRTHGSVDYTSIARRFSHGCHRLVNARAVRLFGFVLRHRNHERLGDSTLKLKKYFQVENPGGEPRRFGYELTTRGYYYELRPPVPVTVLEGRVLGAIKQPITTFVPKPGVDYGEDGPIENTPVVGP
jgi:hypothetical protein